MFNIYIYIYIYIDDSYLLTEENETVEIWQIIIVIFLVYTIVGRPKVGRMEINDCVCNSAGEVRDYS